VDELSDEQLLALARREREAFALFYRRHALAVHTWFSRRATQDAGTLDDLTAETFAQALVSLGKFRSRGDGSAAAWLYAIARNQQRQFHRRRRISEKARRELGMEIDGADDGFERGEERALALDLVRICLRPLSSFQPTSDAPSSCASSTRRTTALSQPPSAAANRPPASASSAVSGLYARHFRASERHPMTTLPPNLQRIGEQLEHAWRPAPPSDASWIATARGHHRRTLVSLAVVVAVAAIVLLAISAGRDQGTTASARTLDGLARVAAEQPVAGNDTYTYLRTRATLLGGQTDGVREGTFTWYVYEPVIQEEWVSRHGDYLSCTKYGQLRLRSANDRRAWRSAHSPDFNWRSDTLIYKRDNTRFLRRFAGVRSNRLPTTAAAIAALVRRRPFNDVAELFYRAQEVLMWSAVSPHQRSALLRYLATVRGISVPGDGIRTDHGVKSVLIFDPSTSQIIGLRVLSRQRAATQSGGDQIWSDYLTRSTVKIDALPPMKTPGLVHTTSQEFHGAAAIHACSSLPRS
jgi:RNA polymerase sigma-70 factor (ECF subfamily)